MKTIRLAELFKLLVHQKLFMMVFLQPRMPQSLHKYNSQLCCCVRSLYALFILISKNDQFCFITFAKKAEIFN